MATLIDHEFFARLRALNEKFSASVPATLGRLDDARRQFDPAAPDPELIKDIHQTLHTIAGSAATFGFRTLGLQARELEQRLRVLMAFPVVGADDWRHWLAGLAQYLAWGALDPKADYYPGDSAPPACASS